MIQAYILRLVGVAMLAGSLATCQLQKQTSSYNDDDRGKDGRDSQDLQHDQQDLGEVFQLNPHLKAF